MSPVAGFASFASLWTGSRSYSANRQTETHPVDLMEDTR
jgi:hypothetical protein